MKKLLVILIILFAVPAWGAPFLVCDPQAGVTGYTLAGLTTATVPAQADGSLKYDLVSVSNGTYNVSVAACNVWGCSSTVPFVLSKQAPLPPVGVRIQAQ